jgi:hypothetical protein
MALLLQKMKEERTMSKFKIVGMTVLIVFAMAILLVGNAVAGEKFKGRTVWYATKWEKMDVPGEEKHLVLLQESKGISSNTEGKAFGEGVVWREVVVVDVDLKAETGFGHAYDEGTDRDGDKIYYRSEIRRLKGKFREGAWEVKSIILRGTGKYEGIKGEGTSSAYEIAPMQLYEDWEMEVEFPR